MRAAPRHTRAFTLLELLLAMVVGSLILAGGFGLVSMTERLDHGFAARLDATTRLAFVQRTFSRSLHTIVAAPEGYDPQQAAVAAAAVAERAERLRRTNRQDENEPSAVLEPGAGDPDGQAAAVRARRDVEPAPPRFRMGHLAGDGESYENREDAAAEGVRRLELLLARPPFGERDGLQPVRGAFDLVPSTSPRGDRWRLQWTPIEPAGDPTVLLENLELAEWSVTDARGQVDIFSTYERDDLPWTVRVVLWTESGVKVDWMFDLGAATTTGEPL